MSRATATKSSKRNVALGLAIVPGLVYGFGWLAFGQYAGHGFWAHLGLRLMGALLVIAACNLAWRLVRNTGVWMAFAAYIGCFASALAIVWALLAP